MSVGLHLMSIPESDKLFRAAIMESNVFSVPYANAKQADLVGKGFVKLINSMLKNDKKGDDLYWLQSLPVNVIMKAQNYTLPEGIFSIVTKGMAPGTWWTPTIGVSPITDQPINGYSHGNSPKPYIFGFNRNEGDFFLAHPETFTENDLEKLIVYNFGKAAYKTILDFEDKAGEKPYNPKTYKFDKKADMTPSAQAYAKIMTDYSVAYGSLQALQRNWAKQKSYIDQPVYAYYFTELLSFNYQNLKRCDPTTGRACHTYELPYVFHNFVVRQPDGSQTIVKDVSPEDIALSEIISKSWAGFAKDPYNWQNGFGFPPLDYALTGKYINLKHNPEKIDNITDLVNYQLWTQITPATQLWADLVKFHKTAQPVYEDISF